MNLLFERWTGLRKLPYTKLIDTVTPVERLANLSFETKNEVWCKRDDQSHALYGGNKVRKLEFILGDALSKGAQRLITTGAAGSHHVLATSLFGKSKGLAVDGVLTPQPWTPHVEETLRADVEAGTTIHFAKTLAQTVPQMMWLAAKQKHTYLIPPGGSSPIGTLGYVVAGLELAEQITTKQCPEPKSIFVAMGSAGTVCGLAIGLAAAGVRSRVVGVRVVDSILVNRGLAQLLIRKTVAWIKKHDARFPDITALALQSLDIDPLELGEGYGLRTPEGDRASVLAGKDHLTLDPTYTAKAMASTIRDSRKIGEEGPRLFVHTLSSAPIQPLLKSAQPLPSDYRERLSA